MNRTDLRKIFPNVVIFKDRVDLLISEDESYSFSKEAWNFFSDEFDELVNMDKRFRPLEFGLCGAYPTKCARMKQFYEGKMAVMEIYPGSYMGEWMVSFYEVRKVGGKSDKRFETHLRTATGAGSVDKRNELKKMFEKIS